MYLPSKELKRTGFIVMSLMIFGGCSEPLKTTETDTMPAADTIKSSVPGAVKQQPNIVLILADDMGQGDISAYNSASKIPTPSLDELAKNGMRFTDAHSSSSVCTPTRYGLLTGRYAWRTSMKKGVLKGYSPLMVGLMGRSTIASMLKDKGYATAAIGKWHLGLGDREVTDYSKPLSPGPNSLGFDYFFGIPASLDMPPYTFVENTGMLSSFEGQMVEESARRRLGGDGYWHAGHVSTGFDHNDVLPEITNRSEEYIQNHKKSGSDKPFFLYVPFSSPHTPWLPTKEFRGKSQAGHYGDFVAQVDGSVGRIIKALEATGQAENTIILFAADNGARWQAEDIAKYGHRANANNRGMKGDVFEGGHRIPLIVSW